MWHLIVWQTGTTTTVIVVVFIIIIIIHCTVSLRPVLSQSKSCYLFLCCPTSLYPASLYCTTLWPILLCSICRCSCHWSFYSYMFLLNYKFQNGLCIILLYSWSHRPYIDSRRSFISAVSVHLVLPLFSIQFLKTHILTRVSQDSAVSIVIGYGLDDQGARIFISTCHPDCFWDPPSLLSNWHPGLFPQG
jgi:hypothetical protein